MNKRPCEEPLSEATQIGALLLVERKRADKRCREADYNVRRIERQLKKARTQATNEKMWYEALSEALDDLATLFLDRRGECPWFLVAGLQGQLISCLSSLHRGEPLTHMVAKELAQRIKASLVDVRPAQLEVKVHGPRLGGDDDPPATFEIGDNYIAHVDGTVVDKGDDNDKPRAAKPESSRRLTRTASPTISTTSMTPRKSARSRERWEATATQGPSNWRGWLCFCRPHRPERSNVTPILCDNKAPFRKSLFSFFFEKMAASIGMPTAAK